MKKSLRKYIGALVLAAGLVSANTASAVAIKGAIQIAGSVSLDGPLATANQISSWNAGISNGFAAGKADVIDLGGDFLSFGGPPFLADMTDPLVLGGSKLSLLSYAGFTFDLTSSVIESQDANGIELVGYGVLKGNGFDDTPARFFLTAQPPAIRGGWSFSAGVDTNVPEGGTAVALLGLGLIGLAGARRCLSTVKG